MEIRDENGTMRVRPTAGEKAAFSVIVSIVIALLLWVGKTTLETAQAVAVLNTKIDLTLQNQNQRIDALEQRVTNLETSQDRR